MKGSKKLIKIAKDMFKKSLEEGFVSPEKVQSVLKKVISQKHPNLVSILKSYKRLIQIAIAKQQIIVESAAAIENKKELEKELIEKTKAQNILFVTNSKIKLGIRVTHGDWIWDSTLDAKLKQLTLVK